MTYPRWCLLFSVDLICVRMTLLYTQFVEKLLLDNDGWMKRFTFHFRSNKFGVNSVGRESTLDISGILNTGGDILPYKKPPYKVQTKVPV